MTQELHAFPSHGLDVPLHEADGPRHRGMSLRDYFAAAALQGMCADHVAMGKIAEKTGQQMDEMLARAAYHYADAMLRARAPHESKERT